MRVVLVRYDVLERPSMTWPEPQMNVGWILLRPPTPLEVEAMLTVAPNTEDWICPTELEG